MSRNFFPRPDAMVLQWSKTFRDAIVADPSEYSLTEAQVESYSDKHEIFAAAFASAINPETRTRANILLKDDAKKTLEAEARMLARIIRANPTITNGQRIALGLSVAGNKPSRINAPLLSPSVFIVAAVGRRMSVRILDSENTLRKGKPAGVANAAVFWHAGENPPASLNDWNFAGNTTRTRMQINVPPSVPAGAMVWVSAHWQNPRAQRGPNSNPIFTNIPGGPAMAV